MYKNNFIDSCLAGEAKPEEVHTWIDVWHTSNDQAISDLPLIDFLGMSWKEYNAWITQKKPINEILEKRRNDGKGGSRETGATVYETYQYCE